MLSKQFKNSINIVNVVVSTKLNQSIDIEKLARILPRSYYEPEIFSGMIYRRENPKSTIILFSTGTITSVGTKSEKLGRNCINATVFEINQKLKVSLKPRKLSTVNVVALYATTKKINLKKLKVKFNDLNHRKEQFSRIKDIDYNPQYFPGATITLDSGKGLIFESGKILSVGSKNENNAKNIIYDVYALLKKQKCM